MRYKQSRIAMTFTVLDLVSILQKGVELNRRNCVYREGDVLKLSFFYNGSNENFGKIQIISKSGDKNKTVKIKLISIAPLLLPKKHVPLRRKRPHTYLPTKEWCGNCQTMHVPFNLNCYCSCHLMDKEVKI